MEDLYISTMHTAYNDAFTVYVVSSGFNTITRERLPQQQCPPTSIEKHIQQDAQYLSKKLWARTEHMTQILQRFAWNLNILQRFAWSLNVGWLGTWHEKLNGCSSCALAVHQACKKRHAITIIEFVLSVNKQCLKQEPFLFQKIEPLCHPSHQLTFFLFVVSCLASAACRFLCLFSSAFCFFLA